jgi:hypothetical protein
MVGRNASAVIMSLRNHIDAGQRFAPRGLLATVHPCQRRRTPLHRTKTGSRARPAPIFCSTRTTRSTGGLGPGGTGRSQAQRKADPALGRLCGLSLVPRDGAREFRGRRHRARDERAVRQHQGRSRGATRHRSDLHGGAASSRRAGRLAADHVSHARRRTDLGRHVFSEFVALRQTGLRRRAARDRAAVPRGAAEDREQPRGADGTARRHRHGNRHRHDRHRRTRQRRAPAWRHHRSGQRRHARRAKISASGFVRAVVARRAAHRRGALFRGRRRSRCTTSARAAFTIISAAVFPAIRSTSAGSSRISRKCSTTTPSSSNCWRSRICAPASRFTGSAPGRRSHGLRAK